MHGPETGIIPLRDEIASHLLLLCGGLLLALSWSAPPGPPFLFGPCFPCPLFGFWSVPWFLPCCDSFVLFLSVCVSACCFAVVFSAASVCLLWCCWVSVFVVLWRGSPSPLAVVSLPPFGCSLAASWSRYCAGPSLWVSGCFMRQPGCLALMLGVLWCFASSLHLASWQQRPLALCGVCVTLYTMVQLLLWCSVLLR